MLDKPKEILYPRWEYTETAIEYAKFFNRKNQLVWYKL